MRGINENARNKTIWTASQFCKTSGQKRVFLLHLKWMHYRKTVVEQKWRNIHSTIVSNTREKVGKVVAGGLAIKGMASGRCTEMWRVVQHRSVVEWGGCKSAAFSGLGRFWSLASPLTHSGVGEGWLSPRLAKDRRGKRQMTDDTFITGKTLTLHNNHWCPKA